MADETKQLCDICQLNPCICENGTDTYDLEYDGEYDSDFDEDFTDEESEDEDIL